jgi:DNA-directed RNA polymerase subunit omega
MKTKIDNLLEWMDNSRFGLTILAAKRARQVNNYFRHLGEGLGQEAGPQIKSASNKSLTMALEEIAADKLEYETQEEERDKEDL